MPPWGTAPVPSRMDTAEVIENAIPLRKNSNALLILNELLC